MNNNDLGFSVILSMAIYPFWIGLISLYEVGLFYTNICLSPYVVCNFELLVQTTFMTYAVQLLGGFPVLVVLVWATIS